MHCGPAWYSCLRCLQWSFCTLAHYVARCDYTVRSLFAPDWLWGYTAPAIEQSCLACACCVCTTATHRCRVLLLTDALCCPVFVGLQWLFGRTRFASAPGTLQKIARTCTQ